MVYNLHYIYTNIYYIYKVYDSIMIVIVSKGFQFKKKKKILLKRYYIIFQTTEFYQNVDINLKHKFSVNFGLGNNNSFLLPQHRHTVLFFNNRVQRPSSFCIWSILYYHLETWTISRCKWGYNKSLVCLS